MKKWIYILSFIGLIAPIEAYASSQAQSTILINKFRKVYQNMKSSDGARVGVMLRLADLLSERARQTSYAELTSGCVQCLAGKKDREEALRLYKTSLPNIKEAQRGRVLAQMGHLYEILDRQKEAVDLYHEVAESPFSSLESKAISHLSLAEIEFRGNRFSTALRHYDAMIKLGVGRQSLAHYKRAWSLFNMGQINKAVSAVVHILKTPKLLTKGVADIVSVDEQYKAEVARDLATFMAKNAAGLKEAKFVFEVSPEKVKISNTAYLANELQRLGQQSAAIEIYQFVLSQESDPFQKISYLFPITKLKKSLKQIEGSLESYAEALELWKSMEKCEQQECKELKSRLRKYVLDWNHDEKENPSEFLTRAYLSYLSTFSNEVDMHLWLSKVYEQRKQLVAAINQNKKVIEIQLAEKAEFKEGAGFKPLSLETLLLGNIELAEKLKDPIVLLQAQNDYLKLSQTQTKSYEVRYQKARDLYKASQYEPAAQAFKDLALNEQGPKDLRKKAADLALDSLVLTKNAPALEEWSKLFETGFPEHAAEFRAIHRKTILNQSAQLAESKNLQDSWEVLLRFDTSSATAEELVTFYKNKVILAEKLGKLTEARLATESFLALSNLSTEERKMAMGKKAWFAELVLDFRTAYEISQSLKEATETKTEKRPLKLALFAELAGVDPTPHYRDYLEISKDTERAISIATQMVRNSKTPLVELSKYKKVLIKKPVLYADLKLQSLAKQGQKPNSKTASELYKEKSLIHTPAGLFAWRIDYISNFHKLTAKIKAHQLSSKTQRSLASSLRTRDKMIRRLEKIVQAAILKKDWSAQVVSMTLLAQESERFFTEILSLPMPEGLSEQEQMQYMGLLSQQASPHNQKAQDIKAKLSEFWNKSNIAENFQKSYFQAPDSLRPWVKEEIQWVSEIAPEEVKKEFQKMTEQLLVKQSSPKKQPVVNFKALEKVRQKVRQQPFNKAVLEKLLKLEKKMGRKAMVTYLSSRIEILPSIIDSQKEIRK